MMTWGEVKTAALQKMFLSAADPYVQNSTTADYISMMPYVANEGLMRLSVVGNYLVKEAKIDAHGRDFALRELIPDIFEAVRSGVMYDGEFFNDYELSETQVMRTAAELNGELTVPYRAYPLTITKDTPDDTPIELDADGAVLLALYIASQLYKEDDISLATQWRNEFETALGAGREKRMRSNAVVIAGREI